MGVISLRTRLQWFIRKLCKFPCEGLLAPGSTTQERMRVLTLSARCKSLHSPTFQQEVQTNDWRHIRFTGSFNHPKANWLVVSLTKIIQMVVSFNGDTPNLHPQKWSIFSRKTPWVVGVLPTHFRSCPRNLHIIKLDSSCAPRHQRGSLSHVVTMAFCLAKGMAGRRSVDFSQNKTHLGGSQKRKELEKQNPS